MKILCLLLIFVFNHACLNQIPDVIGIVQIVSPTMSIRRKSNNETVPKRDIVVADET